MIATIPYKPYESSISYLTKLSFINISTPFDMFMKRKNPSLNFYPSIWLETQDSLFRKENNLSILPAFSYGLKDILTPFWKGISQNYQYLKSKEMKICPKCVQQGCHYYWNEFSFLDYCPLHGLRLQTLPNIHNYIGWKNKEEQVDAFIALTPCYSDPGWVIIKENEKPCVKNLFTPIEANIFFYQFGEQKKILVRGSSKARILPDTIKYFLEKSVLGEKFNPGFSSFRKNEFSTVNIEGNFKLESSFLSLIKGAGEAIDERCFSAELYEFFKGDCLQKKPEPINEKQQAIFTLYNYYRPSLHSGYKDYFSTPLMRILPSIENTISSFNIDYLNQGNYHNSILSWIMQKFGEFSVKTILDTPAIEYNEIAIPSINLMFDIEGDQIKVANWINNIQIITPQEYSTLYYWK